MHVVIWRENCWAGMTTWVKLRRNDDSVEVAGRSELAVMNAKSRFASSLLKLL